MTLHCFGVFFRKSAAVFVHRLESSHDLTVETEHGKGEDGAGRISAFLIDGAVETGVVIRVIDNNRLAADHGGADNAGVIGNPGGGQAVADLAPELTGMTVQEPDGTAVALQQIPPHVRNQIQQMGELPFSGDAGGVVKDDGKQVVLPFGRHTVSLKKRQA